MQNFIALGKKIYDTKNPREVHRMMVFVARCCLNYRRMKDIEVFFGKTPFRREMAEIYPFVYEQPTRGFFYYRSTFDERIRLVEGHMSFLEERFRSEVALGLYSDVWQTLWEMESEDTPMKASLCYDVGQRKEGLASVMLTLRKEPLYQIIFWVGKSTAGEDALYIGAMQGPNMENAKDIVKLITKKCHAYRTKNLILYITQAFARRLGIRRIFAVTNEGYYANNHVRRDRKLKTSLTDFWIEAGGNPAEDGRFYELPLREARKSPEEIPTRKRALYRRRFELLDEIDLTVEQNTGKLLK